MTMNPLPPQAYTKDVLTKAYMWLAHQNGSIKELATTPDILVSLFLKAQRNGDESLETPSIQNFKNELKSLAGLMGELDINKTPSTPAPTPAPTSSQSTFHAQSQPPQTQAQTQTQHHHGQPIQFDSKSQCMINEVREQLNLSSDMEVLRLLISLGYQKAKNLYS